MSPFAEVLAALSARLDLPEPARRRVLLEVAGDLEDLREAGLASGLDERAACARALELAELDEDAIGELAAVHAGAARRMLEGMPRVARSRVERIGLALVGLTLLLFAVQLAGSASLFRDAGALGLASVAGVVAMSLVLVTRWWNARVRGDQRPAPVRAGASWLARLIAVQLVLAFVGLVWSSVATWRSLAEPASADGAAMLREGLMSLRSECALMSLTGLAAVITALAWHRLVARADELERRELELLLELDAAPEPSRSPSSRTPLPCSN